MSIDCQQCHRLIFLISIIVQGEIDAREDSFRSTAESGRLLLESDHYAVEDVKERLVTLANEKTTLLELWEERRILYEQCMDLQLFYRYSACNTLLKYYNNSFVFCFAR